MAQPQHPTQEADSQLAREPGYKPHARPRFVVDLSVFLSRTKTKFHEMAKLPQF